MTTAKVVIWRNQCKDHFLLIYKLICETKFMKKCIIEHLTTQNTSSHLVNRDVFKSLQKQVFLLFSSQNANYSL